MGRAPEKESRRAICDSLESILHLSETCAARTWAGVAGCLADEVRGLRS
jgi:hypothetical protein